MAAHLAKHRRYVEKVNELVHPDLEPGTTMVSVYLAALEEGDYQLFDAASQAFYHALYWRCLDPDREGNDPSMRSTAQDMVERGMQHFGSGWLCLVDQPRVKTYVQETVMNAERPTAETFGAGTVAFTTDLWEHAWYFDYPDGKREYLEGLLLGGYARWDVLDEPPETGGVWTP